jgi:hypothetical protein
MPPAYIWIQIEGTSARTSALRLTVTKHKATPMKPDDGQQVLRRAAERFSAYRWEIAPAPQPNLVIVQGTQRIGESE